MPILQSVLDKISVGVLICDDDGVLVTYESDKEGKQSGKTPSLLRTDKLIYEEKKYPSSQNLSCLSENGAHGVMLQS